MNGLAGWAGIAGVLVIVGYYALAATLIARRHRVPTPPGADWQLSPAAARFIHKGAFDGRTLLAAILGLVAKGALALKQRPDGSAYLEPPLDPVGDDALAEDERLVRTALFRSGNRRVDLTNAADIVLLDTGRLLQAYLELRFVSRPAIARWLWIALILGGIAVALLALMIPMSADPSSAFPVRNAIFLAVFYGAGLAVLYGCYSGARRLGAVDPVGRIVVVVVCVGLLTPALIFLGIKILDHFRDYGAVGIAPLLIPIAGTWLLTTVARGRMLVSPNARTQFAALYKSIHDTGVNSTPYGDHSLSSVIGIEPMQPYRIALTDEDAGMAALVREFESIPASSPTLSLFGAAQAKPVDWGSIGIMAIR